MELMVVKKKRTSTAAKTNSVEYKRVCEEMTFSSTLYNQFKSIV